MIEFEWITAEEQYEMFARAAMNRMGVTGSTFLRYWDEGVYDGPEENTTAMAVAMLYPGGIENR